MQDVLALGSQARMNKPGDVGGNWTWRLEPGQLSGEHASWLRAEAKTSGRLSRSATDHSAT
jgi:4-alpha-glucanotransferase